MRLESFGHVACDRGSCTISSVSFSFILLYRSLKGENGLDSVTAKSKAMHTNLGSIGKADTDIDTDIHTDTDRDVDVRC